MTMCTPKDNISKALTWVNEILPFKTLIINEDKAIARTIPLIVSAPYHFFCGTFADIPIVWVQLKDYEDLTPSVIKRHAEIINNACGLLPVFVIEKTESYKIQRLAKARLNFIIKDKAICLPDFLFIVRNQTKALTPIKKIVDEIPATAQLMILYQIQRHSLDGFTTKQIAHLFNLSYSTVKRAVAWLADKSVLNQFGKKEKVVQFNFDGESLWNFCEPFLRNPIESLHRTTDITIVKHYVTAGEAALSRFTLLSANLTEIAVSKKELTALNNLYKGWDDYGEHIVQTWIYDPEILAEDGLVDRLSLYLSLKNHLDERVQIELENLLNEIKW